MPKQKKTGLDEDGLPKRAGVYLVTGGWGEGEQEEIDVYRHRVKGLCCFADDFGSGGTGVDDKYDCHVSVQNTRLTFIRKVRNLTGKGSGPGKTL